MSALFLGVDIAKASFDAALWRAEGGLHLGTFANEPGGFEELQAALAAHRTPAQAVHLVLEATGGFERRLVRFAHAQGWAVSRPNAKQLRDWARGIGRRAKTDAQDALLLAHFAAERRPPAEEPTPAAADELESLSQRREQLKKMLGMERNRRRALRHRPHLNHAVPTSVARLIQALEEELQAVEQAIEELMARYQELAHHRRLLLTVPGVGTQSVTMLLVTLFRWQARTAGQGSAKGLTAYLGLDPVPRESGRRTPAARGISRLGNRQMRRMLYLCALGGSRGRDTPLTRFYRRLVARGKPSKVALVATAHKILIWSYAVFLSGQPFDPSLHLTPASPAT